MDEALTALLVNGGGLTCLVVAMILTAVDVNRQEGGKGSAEYGGLLAIYLVAIVAVIALMVMGDRAGDKARPLAIIVCSLAVLVLVQKVVFFAKDYSLVFKNDIGDFGYTLVDGVTSMVGRDPDQKIMSFDNTEILEPGQTKGFSISMYMGLNYGSAVSSSKYKWNQKNDSIRVPLFVRGQISKTNLQDTGSQVVDKSPLIWLVLDKSANSGDVAAPFVPRFEVEFNHAQPATAAAASGVDDLGDNACQVVDDITARCRFFKDSATFEAYDDAQDLRIDPSGPDSAKRLKHVAFVFEEVFAGNKMNKDYVTRVSVFVGSKLKQTHTFPGTVRISDNRVSVLPRALFSDSTNPLSSSTTPDQSDFLSECRIGIVKYYAYPLSSDQIRAFAGRVVPLDITANKQARAGGNTDTNIPGSRAT